MGASSIRMSAAASRDANAIFVFERERAGFDNQKTGSSGGHQSLCSEQRVIECGGVRQRRDHDIGFGRLTWRADEQA